MSSNSRRLLWVDALRGVAIVLMVIFHFCYDLRYFGYVDWNIPNGPNWRPFRYVILALFIFTVGLSLALAHGQGVRWKHFSKRLVWLIAAALGITIMSLYMFPEGWIYFGILHFIAFASLAGLLFLRIPLLAGLIGVSILVGYWMDLLPTRWPFNYISGVLPSYTEDYVPIFPWLGVALLGVGLARLLPVERFDVPPLRLAKWLAFLGCHGLIIYVVHQPLLFAVFLAFGSLS